MSQASLGFGAKLQRGDGATPEVFATIPEVTSDITIGIQGALEEVTNHDSLGRTKEYIGGVRDGMEITATANYIAADVTQALLWADSLSGAQGNWKLIEGAPDSVVLTARGSWAFKGIVLDVSVKEPLTKSKELDFKLKIVSTPVFTPGTP